MTNPLLDELFDARGSALNPIPFDRILPEHVEPALSALSARARAEIDRIALDGEPPTYENSLGALDAATQQLELATSVVEHLESTATSEALREAWGKAQPLVSEFWSALPLHAGLYARLCRLRDSAAGEGLVGARRRHLDKVLDEFKRHGAELGAADKKELTEVDVELGKLTTKFQQNVLDSTNSFDLVVEDEALLAGLPDSARKAAKAAAEKKGASGFVFTLHAPSYVPALTYLDDRNIREKLYRAYNARATEGAHANGDLMRQILEKRKRKAQLLGFNHFADYTTSDRMAVSGSKVSDFLSDLRGRTEAFFQREKTELTRFAREDLGLSQPLEGWDVGYVAEKQRRAHYDFDEEVVRAHFPLEHVLSGLFQILSALYEVVFEPAKVPVWDESVRPYYLTRRTGERLATIYVDLFPRANKVQGAWMMPIRSASPPETHVAAVCANFTPPVGGAPSLLSHREVQTLFHEFGHLLHQCLSEVPVRKLSGTSVAWDFVELPSQLHENWVWDKEMIRMLSKHHDKGSPLEDSIIERVIKARTHRAASMQMQQIGYADLDLRLHTVLELTPDVDILRTAREMIAPYVTAKIPDSFAMIASFTHIFGSPVGYAAGYYSYKWAEVLEADAFSRFLGEGLLDPGVGKAFAKAILSRGNSDDPDKLFREFLGRDPKVEALLARQGLTL